MELGISSPLSHRTPEEWAAKHKALGLRTVVFPLSCLDGEERIAAYRAAAAHAGLSVAEVGVYSPAKSSGLSFSTVNLHAQSVRTVITQSIMAIGLFIGTSCFGAAGTIPD